MLFQKKKIHKIQNEDILDIGCAAGEFIYFLKKKLKQTNNIIGADIRSDLLKKQNEI